MAAAGIASLAVSWWASPLDAAIAARGANGMPGPGILVFPRLSPEIFGSRGIVPVGYAAFTFAAGVLIGIAVRRTLPAIAILLALFAVTQVAMAVTVRPNLIAPEHAAVTITAGNLTFLGADGGITVALGQPGAWVTAQHTVNAAGQAVTAPSWVGNCLSLSSQASQACFARLAGLGYRQLMSYQPASRFWALQWEEAAVYLTLAVAASALCAWLIRRRLS